MIHTHTHKDIHSYRGEFRGGGMSEKEKRDGTSKLKFAALFPGFRHCARTPQPPSISPLYPPPPIRPVRKTLRLARRRGFIIHTKVFSSTFSFAPPPPLFSRRSIFASFCRPTPRPPPPPPHVSSRFVSSRFISSRLVSLSLSLCLSPSLGSAAPVNAAATAVPLPPYTCRPSYRHINYLSTRQLPRPNLSSPTSFSRTRSFSPVDFGGPLRALCPFIYTR